MWSSFNPNHDIYQFVKTINAARRAHNVPTSPFAEKWADD